MSGNRLAVIGGALVGLAALAAYGLTLAPDLTAAHWGGDGGELITTAVTLGIPHPPGYPTYVLLGKLFSFLPVGSVAYRFNLFSAVAVALAASIVTITAWDCKSQAGTDSTLKRTGDVAGGHFNMLQRVFYLKLVAISAGLTFAFLPLVWSQAVIAEVYGLNLLFLALFLGALLGKRPSLLTGFFLGLSITTHLTSLFMLPLALWLTPRRDWLKLGAGLLAGLLPLLALPLLAQSGSPVVWGNPVTLDGWWWLISGRIYQANVLALPAAEMLPRLREWGWLLLSQFSILGLVLLGLGFWLYARRGQVKLAAGLGGTAVLYLLYAFTYRQTDAIVLVLPALLLLTFLLLPVLQQMRGWALLLPLILLLLNFNGQNLRDDVGLRPSAMTILQQAPPDAVIITQGDPDLFALWYFHHVEDVRPDVAIVDDNLFAFDWYRQQIQGQYPDLTIPSEDDVAGFVAMNEGVRPFYIDKVTR
ncbi:MAG: DUF2723 domain-containing protein [Chloroflexi bacterium]|nr:DUF2723 domain-containing protein [Chloroflexota bacterium]